MDWTKDSSFKLMVSEVVGAATLIIKYIPILMASAMSDNMMRGINAIRCLVNNLGDNSWNLVAAVYWGGCFVGQKDKLNEYLNLGYGYICTCSYDS